MAALNRQSSQQHLGSTNFGLANPNNGDDASPAIGLRHHRSVVSEKLHNHGSEEADSQKVYSLKQHAGAVRDRGNSHKVELKSSLSQSTTNGRWTTEEHDRFIEGLKKYGKNWNMVSAFVGTRKSDQTRSHAQKFLKRLLKQNDKTEDRDQLMHLFTTRPLRAMPKMRRAAGEMRQAAAGRKHSKKESLTSLDYNAMVASDCDDMICEEDDEEEMLVCEENSAAEQENLIEGGE